MDAKSLFDLLSDRRKQDFADSVGPGYADVDALDPQGEGHEGDEHGFKLQMRRKRKTAILKQMLTNGGYPDLAKTVSVKEF